ncbi:MAG: HAD family phosphatase [Chlamydiales bacterium]
MALIRALFLDVGGVLMTNGWDHVLRRKTAETFNIEYDEMDTRHQLIFDTYETGKLTFDEYLRQIIFFKDRSFELKEIKSFIFNSVQPFEPMINYAKELKKQHGLKIGIVSNEGRELAVDRIQRFDLSSFVDFFIISSFVHYRKPDPDIFRLAIDVAQVPPTQTAYIDDRDLLIEVAKGLGLQGIHHKDIETTQSALSLLL